MAAYLLEGACGLPVFAGTPATGSGLAYIAGPTGGYLAGYLVAAVLVGSLAEGRWTRSIVGTTALLLMGELTILSLGCAWLALSYGWEQALVLGFGRFLIGDAVKLALAVITVAYSRKFTARG
ncbi:MAG TPA: biotin transporter BioY [Sphingomicrobium sp.]|nr:biotin transporter BioY [Sphingomicrobium sp.]